jgi:hypothetical protein
MEEGGDGMIFQFTPGVGLVYSLANKSTYSFGPLLFAM